MRPLLFDQPSPPPPRWKRVLEDAGLALGAALVVLFVITSL